MQWSRTNRAFIVERAGNRKSGAPPWRELASAARAVNTEGRGIGAAAPSTVQSGCTVHGPTHRGDAGTRDLTGRTSSKQDHNRIITTRGGSSLGVSCSITHYLDCGGRHGNSSTHRGRPVPSFRPDYIQGPKSIWALRLFMVRPDKKFHRRKTVKSDSHVRQGTFEPFRQDSANDRPLVATRHDCNNVRKGPRRLLQWRLDYFLELPLNTPRSFRQPIISVGDSTTRFRKTYLFTLNYNRRYLQRVTKSSS